MRKNYFCKSFQLDRPPPPSSPQFSLSFFQNSCLSLRVPPHQEGRFAIVTNVEVGCGGRVDVAAWLFPAPTNIIDAHGQVAWSWHPDADAKFATTLSRRADDGGQKARRTGENAKQPFQLSRGECRDVSAEPVVPAACIFFAGGPWVRPAPGIPCALCSRGQVHRQSSDAISAARTQEHAACSAVVPALSRQRAALSGIGTHSRRAILQRRVSATRAEERIRGMGPGFRRDDS
jgi:hypothetical protein